jgi:hypothetical protein
MRTPDPQTWGTPYSYFHLGEETCPSKHFHNMRLVFDLTLCGDLGDPKFDAMCPEVAKLMSCRDFVERHPEQMKEAYWSILALEVYSRVKVEDTTQQMWGPEETQPRGLRGYGAGDSDGNVV